MIKQLKTAPKICLSSRQVIYILNDKIQIINNMKRSPNNILRYIFIISLFIIIIQCRVKKSKEQPKTIIDANHFYSATEKKANYNIDHIETNKPLILLLKKEKQRSNYVRDFNISLQSGEAKINCGFKKLTDLCIIPNVTQTKLNMIIQCNSLPCEVSWIIYQPEPKNPQNNQIALNLYTLQKSNKHLIGQIQCADPAVTTLDKDVTVYSESQYKRGYLNNALYILFDTEQKGYAFVDIQKNSRACAQISFTQAEVTLRSGQNVTKNFISKQSPTIYEIAEVPKTDFRIQVSTVRVDKLDNQKSSVIIVLSGQKEGSSVNLFKRQIKAVNLRKSNDFTLIFKKPKQQFSKLRLSFQVTSNHVIILNTRLVANNINEIQLGQAVYFTLAKDQSLNFKISKNEEAKESQKSYVIPMRLDQLKVSKNQCLGRQDCEFNISSIIELSENMIYTSNVQIDPTKIEASGKGLYQFEQIEFITLEKKAKHKIRMGDNIFFKKSVKQHKSVQVTVNNPNVILYAACDTECLVPDEKCRQTTGNYHHPFVYQPKQDCQLLINVQGLDNTEFQLSILEDGDDFIELSDGVPFSYTMDSQEKNINFKITLKQKQDVGFNLIAPFNTLKLLVSNSKNQHFDEQSAQQSTDGYIFFEKSMVQNVQFIVSVVKMKQSQQSFTHFTLIVSTSTTKLRLQPSITNYQTLAPASIRQFIFEFDPSERFILSFYVYNMKDQKVSLELKISDKLNWDNSDAMVIDKQTDFIDLQEASEIYCEEEGVESCEIFLKITNSMEVQIDFTITLLSKDAVVELKDGIWQAYPANIMTTTSNFYFYPRHKNENIFVYYHSIEQDLRIAYNLWKFDEQQINPSQWPFPKITNSQQQLHANFKPNSYVMIDKQELQKRCWPNCVLLISFYVGNVGAEVDKSSGFLQNRNFKIMASNNQIQLPEKQKMTLTIGKDEDKDLLIDLKYALDKQIVTFYTNTIIGYCSIQANVYSQKNSECPSPDELADFTIDWGQSQLSIQSIKQVLKTKSMDNDKNIYLCLNIHSDKSCKMSLQYSSQTEGFKKIGTDTYQNIKLVANQTKYYQIEGYIQQFAKITRISGFPFVAIKKCIKNSELKQCMEDFKQSKDLGKQIVVKTQSFNEETCNQCTYLFKFTSTEPSETNFHLQSKYAEIELKQNEILSDFLNQGQTSKYMIHAAAKQDVIVNIQIQQGQAEAEVTNLNNINLNKKSTDKNKIIHFVIKSNQMKDQSNNAMINPIALSKDFVIYHLTIKSINSSKAVSFIISYSSGEREISLQDGVILDYILQSNKLTKFYYCNEASDSHIYFGLSMSNADTLNKLVIKTYYLENSNDQSSKTQITLEKPNINKKNPNPTLLFSLPQHNYFMIQLTNPTSKQQKASLGINHQQVILLPFDHDFPFQLHKKQEINILVDVNIPGFIDFSVKKCTTTQPSFAYTFDYDGFIKQQFMYETILNQQPYFHFTIKANRIGTLYVHFSADADQDSTLSIKAVHTEQKSKNNKLKSGKNGVITYEIINESNAKISVPIVTCEQKPCTGIKYFYMSSKIQSQLISQLVCSSTFFNTAEFNSTQSLKLTKIQNSPQNEVITFNYAMPDISSYLGIKAVSQTGQQVYYQPIEIATLYGKWKQVQPIQQFLMLFLIGLFITILVVFVRKVSRKGYRPLNQSQQE